jgi:LPXTG-motif cell wall-anchored protein
MAVITAALTITPPTIVQRTVALNGPAVVLIANHYTATFVYPAVQYYAPEDDQGAFRFSVGNRTLTMPIEVLSTGSGFVITPDGYIVTNAHVAGKVSLQDDEIVAIAKSMLNVQLQKREFSQSLSDNFLQGYYKFLKTNGQFTNEVDSLQVDLGVANSTGIFPKEFSLDAKIIGDPVGLGTSRDIAVVKVSVDHPLPTVELGSSDSVAPGDPLTVMGYPAGTKIGSSIEPTATSGIVSALKEEIQSVTWGGFKAIQTDAAINHGNSGGPAFDANGKVIGLATFAFLDYQNIGFLLPINLAKQFLTQVNVHNSRGRIDELWSSGLELYWAHNYAAAKDLFKQVQQLYPGHTYASRYIDLASIEIQKGNDIPLSTTSVAPPSSGSSGPAALIILILVIVILGGGALLYRRKRERSMTPLATPRPSLEPPVTASPQPSFEKEAIPYAPPPYRPPTYQAQPPTAHPPPSPQTLGPSAPVRFCRECGRQVKPGTAFCARCGAPTSHRS